MKLTTVSSATLACALASTAWAQEAPQAPGAAATSDQTPPAKKTAASAGEEKKAAVSEVVVTGTNIKGVQPIAPVITITREDINRSGYADIGDVMRSLPEDFAGGSNPGNIGGVGIANENGSNGSTVDLFGLGSDATLTLINGHRLPGDYFYQAPDISVIPLAAVQRVEVVTDGSSAIYGSDAVAGVVNFILRKDFNGLEATAYVGGATEGGNLKQIYSLLGGITRSNWHVLVNAEYEHEDPITAAERDFTSGAYGPTTLIFGQTTKTVFVSGGINITDRISLSVDGIYSDRKSEGVYGDTGIYRENEQLGSPNYNVAATLGFKLPHNWEVSLVGATAGDTLNEAIEEHVGSSVYPDTVEYKNNVSSVEATATGSVVTLPTGDLRAAIGGGYRHEIFNSTFPGEPELASDATYASRDVEYAYSEALIPLVAASNDRLGLQELELSASGRYEHYNSFGGTANPKVGLRYVPLSGLNIRATWGTSFKAPSLFQTYQAPEVVLYPIVDFGGKGTDTALYTAGGNIHLRPERSTNWTVGADYSLPTLQSLVLSVTYFDIDYTNRIVTPISDTEAVLTDPAYAAFVTANPSSSIQQSIIAEDGPLSNYTGLPYNSSTVGLLVQNAYQNAVSQVDTGVDISYRQSFAPKFGDIRTFANATWNHLTQQLSSTAPVQTISGTIFNVPTFRARGGVSWSKYGLTATAILNYTASETDTAVIPNQSVSSLTTVDANISYKFPDNVGIVHGITISVSATNLFDRQPPYISTGATYPGIHYDSLNASAIGRFVAFKVTKKL
jgi:outer membrane receptor protein involved in Fe transport